MRCTTDFFLHVVDRAAHLPADCHSQITIRQKRRLSKDRHAYIFALVAIYISRLWMSQFILHTFECTPLPDAEYKVVNKDLPHFSSWRDHLGCLGTWQPCPVVCTFVIHPGGLQDCSPLLKVKPLPCLDRLDIASPKNYLILHLPRKKVDGGQRGNQPTNQAVEIMICTCIVYVLSGPV